MTITEREYVKDVIASNPVVVFTHRTWPSSAPLLRRFRDDGVVAHEVRVDVTHELHGSRGEPQMKHELEKLTNKKDIDDAVLFINGELVENVDKIADLRGFCSTAGAKIFPVVERHQHHVGMGPWQAERGD
jgi:hypothetical protein